MNIWPLKFHKTNNGLIFSDDAGSFFRADDEFLRRYATNDLMPADGEFLAGNGHTYDKEGDLAWTSFAYRWSQRQSSAQTLSYVILVPTLRCNLTCNYCQVSRAAENAKGFDWTDDTLLQAIAFLDNIKSDELKVEFQGGEPLLRLDILEAIRSFCRQRFIKSQFVVCTNLQNLTEKEWSFLAADDTYISTSLDGDYQTHKRQRTRSPDATDIFFANLREAARRFPSDKISALPTIDVNNPPDFDVLIENFERFGINSIYLRPINYQGFARKLPSGSSPLDRWNSIYFEFLERIVSRNFATGSVVEEYYFSQCLKRVLSQGKDNHVDLRNPNFFASDYVVVDFDGSLYPTDEARMLTRIGRVDLRIGNLIDGLDQSKISLLNASSLNNFDPDCIHCAFQPYCGSDVVDDLSRYGRIDTPKHLTWFCGRHTAIFDKVFEFLFSDDPSVQYSVAQWLGIGRWNPNMVRSHR